MSSFPQSAVTQPGATSGASSVNQEKTGTAGVCRTCPVHQAKGQHDDQHQVDHALCAAEKVCIQEVMNRYYHYFDTQNVEAWLALWSKDGEFRTNRSQGAPYGTGEGNLAGTVPWWAEALGCPYICLLASIFLRDTFSHYFDVLCPMTFVCFSRYRFSPGWLAANVLCSARLRRAPPPYPGPFAPLLGLAPCVPEPDRGHARQLLRDRQDAHGHV